MLYHCHQSVCPLHFVFATPLKPFEGFWWNLVHRKITLCRCAYCKGSPVQLFFKELQPLDLAFSMKNTLSSQFILNPLEDFHETSQKEKTQWGGMHIVREDLIIFIRPSFDGTYYVMALSVRAITPDPLCKEWGHIRRVKSPALRHRIFKFSKSEEIGSIVKNE
jgi:hypothetical protein